MEFRSLFAILIVSLILAAAGEEQEPGIPRHFLAKFKCRYLVAKDFQQFLSAMEYTEEDKRKIYISARMEFKITKVSSDEYVHYVRIWPFKSVNETFKLDEEFDTELFDGRKYKATMSMSGGNLTRVEKHGSFEARHVNKCLPVGYCDVEYTANDKSAKLKFFRNG